MVAATNQYAPNRRYTNTGTFPQPFKNLDNYNLRFVIDLVKRKEKAKKGIRILWGGVIVNTHHLDLFYFTLVHIWLGSYIAVDKIILGAPEFLYLYNFFQRW